MTGLTAIPLARPEITAADKAAVNRVMQSASLSRGPELNAFEQAFSEYCQIEHAIGVSSGTSALEIILRGLGVSAGDEVILPSFTVPATANAVVNVGAVPVFADIEPNNFGLCIDSLRAARSNATKAIIVVHAFGMSASIEAIANFADEHDLYLVEDACEALGTHWGNAALGTIGSAGAFGFYPNKQITTGEGGMIITADARLAETFRRQRNNGRSMKGDWLDQHSPGQNARLSELAAALGRSQLSRIEETINRRAALMRRYTKALRSVPLVVPRADRPALERTSWFACVVQLNRAISRQQRDELLPALSSAGIQAGRYFAPLHLQPAFANLSAEQKALTTTEQVADSSITLPFYNQLTDGDLTRVTDALAQALDNLSLQVD